jgi:hypothetical protein
MLKIRTEKIETKKFPGKKWTRAEGGYISAAEFDSRRSPTRPAHAPATTATYRLLVILAGERFQPAVFPFSKDWRTHVSPKILEYEQDAECNLTMLH